MEKFKRREWIKASALTALGFVGLGYGLSDQDFFRVSMGKMKDMEMFANAFNLIV